MKTLYGTYFAVVFVLGFFFLGCSREPQGNTSQLSMAVDSGALSGKQLFHIAVNVQGPGLAHPIVWEWDSKGPGGVTQAPPPQVELNLPSGKGRIIQYLGVYEDLTTHQLDFSYGDRVMDLGPGDQVVDLISTFIGSSPYEGTVGGRYLRADGYGPTDVIIGELEPPASASVLASPPPMVITRHEIFAGWFKVMVLSGDARFSYRLMRSKELLFYKMNLESNNLLTTSMDGKKMRIQVPAGVRSFGDGGMEPSHPSYLIYGVFGLGRANSPLNVCYSSTPESIDYLYTDATLATQMSWDPSTCSSSSICVQAGGTPSCSGGSDFVNQLRLDPQTLNEGSDNMFGFRGPFVQQGTHHEYLLSSYSGSNLDLSWKYLPGVGDGPEPIDGSTVFANFQWASGQEFEGGMEGMPCDRMHEYGFQPLADVPVGAQSVSLSIPAAQLDMTKIVVCPYSDRLFNGRQYFISAVSHHDCLDGASNCSSQGGQPGSGPGSYGDGSDGDLTIMAAENASSFSYVDANSNSRVMAAARKVSNISADRMTLTVSAFSPSEFEAGDEVVWMVMAAGGSGSPDTVCGGGLYRGRFGFSGVNNADTGSQTLTLMDPVGDGGHDNGAISGTPPSPFCYIQVVRVPHFNNLTIDNTRSLEVDAFDYTVGVGGLLVLRAQQALTVNGMLAVSEKGFTGGIYTGDGYQGSGIEGPGAVVYGTAFVNGGGAANAAEGSGGGGMAGAGGSGGGNSGAGTGVVGGLSLNFLCASNPCFPFYEGKAFMGGGGGGSNTTGGDGGSGGGILMIFASEMNGYGTVKANGGNGGSVALGGGGGAGGTISLFVNLFNSFTGTVEAFGGTGGSFASGYGGGGGSGGVIQVDYCSGTPPSLAPGSNTAGGAGGTGVSGYDGAPGAIGATNVQLQANCP